MVISLGGITQSCKTGYELISFCQILMHEMGDVRHFLA
jgi:hypothetical protein